MSGKKLRSRKLFYILAFLLIDTNSVTNLLMYQSTNNANSSLDLIETTIEQQPSKNRSLWFVDEMTGLCLGSYGFSECSEVNLWNIWYKAIPERKDELFILESSYQSTDSKHIKNKKNCLGRNRHFIGKNGELKVLPCSMGSTSPTVWKYDVTEQKLFSGGLASNVLGAMCVSSAGSLTDCKHGFVPLKQILFASILKENEDRDVNRMEDTKNAAQDSDDSTDSFGVDSSLEIKMNIIHPGEGDNGLLSKAAAATTGAGMRDPLLLEDVGSTRCPITGLRFPKNLDNHFRHNAFNVSNSPSYAALSCDQARDNRQVYVGGGIYRKRLFGMNFNVYAIGWYVEATAVQSHPSFARYKDKGLDYLQNSPDFFELMTRPVEGGFDRSILIKLALTIKRELLIQGLVEELSIQPHHASVLLNASSIYTDEECHEGLEVLFTWRQRLNRIHRPSSSPSSSSPTSASEVQDSLEIRIGRKVFLNISDRGLAEDFFYQFFRPDFPVSQEAKLQMISNFPALLSSKNHPYRPTVLPCDVDNDRITSRQQDGSISSSSSSISSGMSGAKALSSPSIFDHISSLTGSIVQAMSGHIVFPSQDSWLHQRIDPLMTYYSYCIDHQPIDLDSQRTKQQQIRRQSIRNYINEIYNDDEYDVQDDVSSSRHHGRTNKWQIHFNNMIMKKRSNSWQEESIAFVIISLYCSLLILMCLPPALVQRGVRAVERVKQRSISKIKKSFQKTLSTTSSLVAMTRPVSTDIKLYLK